MQTIDEALAKLQKSKFRSGFHLTKKDIDYINEKGLDVIRTHAADFVAKRLAPAEIRFCCTACLRLLLPWLSEQMVQSAAGKSVNPDGTAKNS